MINLEIPRKFERLVGQAHQVATEVFRPISRNYDRVGHAYPKELDMLAAVIDRMEEGTGIGGAGASGSAAPGETRLSRKKRLPPPPDAERRRRRAVMRAPGGQ